MERAGSRLLGVHWVALGIVVIPAALGFSTLVEKSSEWREQHLEQRAEKKAQVEDEERVQAQSDLALNRISGDCVILFDNATGEPTFSLKTAVIIENAKKQPVAEGATICSQDGSTATVTNHLGALVPANIASVTREDFDQYSRLYSTYPEVKSAVQNNNKTNNNDRGE